MPGPRPEQGSLTCGNDLSKTSATRRTIEGMIDGLNDLAFGELGRFFHEDFRWMGNAGCGTKTGLQQFKNNWVLPFRAAFTDKVCIDEARIAEGEWMAAFGHQEATHSGEFMGIAPTGKRVHIRYMDFWKVREGKIVDNWVMVDFPHVLGQLGVDIFNGQGWEAYDDGRKRSPQPAPDPD
jgi:predicted ester cyclase